MGRFSIADAAIVCFLPGVWDLAGVDEIPDDFLICPCCGVRWGSRRTFLADPEIELAGYQPNFTHLHAGLFLFTHRNCHCGTTLAVTVSRFEDLYAGPRFEEYKVGSPDCPGYCLDWQNRKACWVKCDCVYVRGILEVLGRAAPEREAVAANRYDHRH